MEFKDRQGLDLNRKRLKIVSQTPTEMIVDVERYDKVSEEGTRLNAETLNRFQQEIKDQIKEATSTQYTTVYVSGTPVAQVNFNSDPQTQISNNISKISSNESKISNLETTKADKNNSSQSITAGTITATTLNINTINLQ